MNYENDIYSLFSYNYNNRIACTNYNTNCFKTKNFRHDYNGLYIPTYLFNKIGDSVPNFIDYKLLGIVGDNLYFYNTFNKSFVDNSQKSVIDFVILNYKDYSYFTIGYDSTYFQNHILYKDSTLGTNEYEGNILYRNVNNYLPRFFNANSDYVISSDYSFRVGTSALDDFLYSTKSTDIFVMGIYFFIPLLLFILAIKVLRKGLFK